MRRIAIILAALLALFTSGCMGRGKQPQHVATAAPPPPTPAPPPAPAPAPPPVSIPQTQAELPKPQPISAEALATLNQPDQPPENQPARGSRRAAQGPVVGPPKPPDTTAPVQAQTQPAAAVPVEQEPPRPPVQEIVPAGEVKRLQDSAQARKREIKKTLEQAQAHPLNSTQNALVNRIKSFVRLSDEAEGRSDMRQADALAERAQVLARELQGGR